MVTSSETAIPSRPPWGIARRGRNLLRTGGRAALEAIRSPATAEAMTVDGVKKETVKVYVFDKEFQP